MEPCGDGSCSNYPGSFNCTCPDGLFREEGSKQCGICPYGFKPEELTAIIFVNVADSWKEARDICSNYGNGDYTLPVPDSQRYHNFISNLISDDSEIPLGFSDELEEGIWKNIYTGKWIDKLFI